MRRVSQADYYCGRNNRVAGGVATGTNQASIGNLLAAAQAAMNWLLTLLGTLRRFILF
jgi:hypothetical protein